MKGESGLELASYARTKIDQPPLFVLMSGNLEIKGVNDNLKGELTSGQIDHFIQKPFGMSELSSLFKKLSEKKDVA